MPRALIERLQKFRERHFRQHEARYRELVSDGQHPSVLLVCCSDSRVMPHLLLDSMPGEVFVVRNAGNLVPPYEGGGGFHGTCASIEFAVGVLGVSDIVVCGHSHCGALRALYRGVPEEARHLARWLELAREAVLPVTESEEVLRRVEQRSIVLQIEHLLTYPMVRARHEKGELAVHGWHYVIESGEVNALDADRHDFQAVPTAEAAIRTPF